MKRGLGILISITLVLLIMLLVPAEINVRKGLAILAFAATLWITEALPLPVTSLLVPVAAVFSGVLDVKSAFSSFAHPIIFLFFGGFALATALMKYELDRFLAFKIVSFSKGSLFWTAVLLFAATAFVSMWISNTSTTAMMLPLALGIAGAAGADDRLKVFLLLGVAYSASVGGIGTLVGSPPNGITAANLGMAFSDWLKFGIPTVIILFPVLIFILRFYFKPDFGKRIVLEKVGFKLTKERIGVLLIFTFTVLLWLFGKKVAAILGIGKYFDSVVAVLAVLLLFLFGLVNWEEIDRGTDWGTLYLFGGGIALSHVLKTTGASKYLASILTGSIGGLPHLFVVFAVTLFMIFLTELMSNTATAAIFVPILVTTASQMGLPAHELALPAGIAASCAFMLPVATPPNAIVYGTGFIKQRDMIRIGLILNITFAAIIAILTVFLVNRMV